MNTQQKQRPKDREIVELNGVKNFFINAGEKFVTIENNGVIRQDYARRKNDNYGFPVRTNNAIEFITRANEIAENLLRDLIEFYKNSEDIDNWREFAKKEGLLISTAFRIYQAINSRREINL
jgi:hypothetical protein